MSEEVGCKNWR